MNIRSIANAKTLRLIEFCGRRKKHAPNVGTSRTRQENLTTIICGPVTMLLNTKDTGCTSNDAVNAQEITGYAIDFCPFFHRVVHDALKTL